MYFDQIYVLISALLFFWFHIYCIDIPKFNSGTANYLNDSDLYNEFNREYLDKTTEYAFANGLIPFVIMIFMILRCKNLQKSVVFGALFVAFAIIELFIYKRYFALPKPPSKNDFSDIADEEKKKDCLVKSVEAYLQNNNKVIMRKHFYSELVIIFGFLFICFVFGK